MQKTWTAKPGEVTRRWYVVDAEGQTLGRLATRIADTLRGKDKPEYTPHVDTGDFVVVVNAEKVRLTGRKLDNKRYFGHTGYMGHERFTVARDLMAKHPDRVIEKAVFGMLPKTSLARQKLRGKLKVYAGPEHPHAAQQPKPFSVTPSKVTA
jgi:large subunit ribosomal protein L13